MDEKMVSTLVGKLDAIIKLMVFAMADGKSQTEQIRLLSAAGFGPKEIAEAIGTTSNTVRVTLFSLRKHKKEKTRRRKKV
jgi:DNA-directed RNA polymerase specialized sigma24 family protein